jgi:hypothetical protein
LSAGARISSGQPAGTIWKALGKWCDGRYETDGVSTLWVKIKNPDYSQMVGRRELFETRRNQRRRSGRDHQAPALRLRREHAYG